MLGFGAFQQPTKKDGGLVFAQSLENKYILLVRMFKWRFKILNLYIY